MSHECLNQICNYLWSGHYFPLIKNVIWKAISTDKVPVFPYAMLSMTPARWSGQLKPNESINRLWRASCHQVDIWICQFSFGAGLDEHMHVSAHTFTPAAPDSVIPHWKPIRVGPSCITHRTQPGHSATESVNYNGFILHLHSEDGEGGDGKGV